MAGLPVLYRYTGKGGLSFLIVIVGSLLLLGALDGITQSGWVSAFVVTGLVNYMAGRHLNSPRMGGRRPEHTFNGFAMEATSAFSALLAITAVAGVIGHIAGSGIGWLVFGLLIAGFLGWGFVHLARQGEANARDRDDDSLADPARARCWSLKPFDLQMSRAAKLATGTPDWADNRPGERQTCRAGTPTSVPADPARKHRTRLHGVPVCCPEPQFLSNRVADIAARCPMRAAERDDLSASV